MKYLLIISLLLFTSVGWSKDSEDFPDGKYFASVFVFGNFMYDKPRWSIIINKNNNIIEVISLKVTKSKVGCCCCALEIPDMELSDRLVPKEIVNNKFDFGRFKFVKNTKLWFYGEFGRFSIITFSLYASSGPIEARFNWVPYKFYEIFQKEFLENPELTTEDFIN